MLAGEARKTTSRNSSGEENYIHGNYHGFREARSNSSSNSSRSMARSTLELINWKDFQNLTQNLGTLNLNSPLKTAENEQDGTFDQRADGIISQKQDSFRFNDDDFLSDVLRLSFGLILYHKRQR